MTKFNLNAKKSIHETTRPLWHMDPSQKGAPLNSEKFMRRAVYHKVYVLKNFMKNKDLRPIHFMDCVKMVQYHNLWSLASNSEYFGYTRPWKSGPNLISSVRPFSQMAAFQCESFSLEKRVVFIGMRVTLWKPGLFIINRAENKRLYIYQYLFFWF